MLPNRVAAVKKIDKVKPPRSFSDKDEWRAVLETLQASGLLAYSAASDEITLTPAVDA